MPIYIYIYADVLLKVYLNKNEDNKPRCDLFFNVAIVRPFFRFPRILGFLRPKEIMNNL